MHHQCITRAALVALVLGCVAAQAQTFDPQVISGAMRRAGDGYSSDELLLRDDLRQKFLQLVANDTAITIDRSTERAALLELLKLRKAGKADLAKRLQQHSSGSDRESLADYLASEESEGVSVELHIFPADSPAKRVVVRRAYESELIRSREPKFNVRP